MKRLFDLFFGVILGVFFLLPMLFIAIIVRISSNGPALFWSERIGRGNVIFKMPKFRSMRVDSPNIASHLIKDPNDLFSPVGAFLRNSSLDELPQLFSIVKGDMSFVGPRPALFNQYDLIALRIEKGIDKLPPGVTGWAQINGRDNLSIEDKVALDDEYLHCQSYWFDMKILWITILKVIKRDNISH